MLRTPIVLFLLVLFILPTVNGQPADTLLTDKRKVRQFAAVTGAGYGIGVVAMYQLWYKDIPRQSFRFFNDNAEWKQIDKAGHFFSAFYISKGTAHVLRDCGIPSRRSAVIGSLTGFALLLPVEIFDGYSEAYGASTGDLIANAAGSSFFLVQQALWNDIRIHPKFSFHPTRYAAHRPEVLGDNTLREIFKDYNGQTYWLSIDADKFMPFPEWLNITVGLGAEDMVYARDHENHNAGFHPYRQYYLSVDFDLSGIQSRSKVVNTLLFLANLIKLPAPTLMVSKKGVHLYPLYF